MGPRNQEDRLKDERKCTQTNFSSLSHDSKYQICPLGLAPLPLLYSLHPYPLHHRGTAAKSSNF